MSHLLFNVYIDRVIRQQDIGEESQGTYSELERGALECTSVCRRLCWTAYMLSDSVLMRLCEENEYRANVEKIKPMLMGRGGVEMIREITEVASALEYLL